MQYAMIRWMSGILFIVAVLVGIILWKEPEREGVSRAAAYKAAALSLGSAEECVGESYAQKSFFAADEKNNWYVKYMDYLYRRQIISEELTPANSKTAEGMLNYEEAAYMLKQLEAALSPDDGGKGIKEQIKVTRWNRHKAFPQERWWPLYEQICQLPDQPAVTEMVLTIYGTPDNMEDAHSWTVYTDRGYYQFEGLSLSRYLDTQIQVLMRGSEIIHVLSLLSEDVVYKNVWITSAEEEAVTGYLGLIQRTMEPQKKIKDSASMVNQVADIYMSAGRIKKLVLKKERISGKVLAVQDQFIEIEGYGPVPLDDNFSVYKLYGEFERQNLSDILVGYDFQEFVVADGKLCAALTMRSFQADTIRVLIMDTGFESIFHDTVELEFLCSGSYIVNKKEKDFSVGDTLTLTADHELLKEGRIVFEPDDEMKGIRITSMERSYGIPVYPGRLEVVKAEDGLVIINELYLEDYLKRVVPSEMPVSYEKEALKAQAVCARTYAYRQIQGNSYMEYGAHVDDSTRFQVYNNLETSVNSDMAVNETYGKLLTYEDDVAEAFYFSTSCGHTTDGTIWGADLSTVPYLKGIAVKDGGGELDLTTNDDFAAFIKSSPSGYESDFAMYRWSTKLTSSQLEQKISDIGTITKVAMKERSTGGIGSVLVIEGTEGSREIKGESKIRSTLGNPELVIKKQNGDTVTGWSSLPSAFITIERSEPDADQVTTFTIYGGGYGHGVGMSQNGAQGMAKAGKNYRQILEFFYQGAEVKVLDN